MERAPHPPSWWHRTLVLLADLLPMSPQDQEEDDRLAARGVDQSERRLQRLRMSLFEKRGKGGFR